MKKERINVAEILRNCQAGMDLNCVCFENVVFDRVDDKNRIRCFVGSQRDEVSFNEYGCLNNSPSAKCVIFPKGETTWNNPSNIFNYKDGDILYCKTCFEWVFIYKKTRCDAIYRYVSISCDSNNLYTKPDRPLKRDSNFKELRLATEKEKQQLFDAIKTNGYKWNEETKTLEKLIPNKFDVNTLKPFESRVLVRDLKRDQWKPAIFGCCTDKSNYYVLGGTCWIYCIPYEHNEHLLGTTDDCDDFYKIWEE